MQSAFSSDFNFLYIKMCRDAAFSSDLHFVLNRQWKIFPLYSDNFYIEIYKIWEFEFFL